MNNISSLIKPRRKPPIGSEIYRNSKSSTILLLFILLTICFTSGLSAQNENPQDIPKDAEPPPFKIISKEEREKLDNESNVKERTKLSLELMNLRLQKAEDFSGKDDYKAMFNELGRFHALVDNALFYLKRNDTGRGGFLNHFKRLEMGLRDFLPRLELIRRELPLNFEYYVRNLILDVRDARRKAVDPFFDDTVLPNNKKGN